MAKASIELVRALRQTAQRLREGAPYQWGHFGACNCGHLAQTITRFTPGEIHRLAMEQRALDWGDEAQQFVASDRCEVSNLPFDRLLDALVDAGLDTTDLHHLERLEDPQVLGRLPGGSRWLKRNDRADAVEYFEAWARLLEERLFAAARPTSQEAPSAPLAASPLESRAAAARAA